MFEHFSYDIAGMYLEDTEFSVFIDCEDDVLCVMDKCVKEYEKRKYDKRYIAMNICKILEVFSDDGYDYYDFLPVIADYRDVLELLLLKGEK